jgi:hypothetical protein
MSVSERVSFVVVGVQKGGTTALFDYLMDEPGLALSREKEAHFFDDETQDWGRPDYAAYHALFPAFDGRPRGEATPIYIYWPNALERLRAYNPEARLILLLRDPVQRAWSHWRMEYARGVETEPFGWCIRKGRQRLFEAEPWGHHREFSYVERGFYGEQVERLLGLYPREQLLVLTSDSLKRAPGEALGKVRAFLGQAPGGDPGGREVHVGAKIQFPSELTAEDVAWLQELYRDDQRRLEALTGVRFF